MEFTPAPSDCDLVLWCARRRCGYSWQFKVADLIQARGDKALAEIRRDAVCARCRAVGMDITVQFVGYTGAGG